MSGRQDGAWARGEQSASCSLYRRLLGPAWAQLPAAVAAMHDVADTGERVARGWVDVERGRGALARLAATLAGFPDAADAGEIEVRFEARDGIEIWTRTLRGQGVPQPAIGRTRGRNADLLAEDLGPFRILMSLVPSKTGGSSSRCVAGSSFSVCLCRLRWRRRRGLRGGARRAVSFPRRGDGAADRADRALHRLAGAGRDT
jgi:hypothetical protein